MIFQPMAVIDGTFATNQASPNACLSIFQLPNRGMKQKRDSFLKGKTWQNPTSIEFHRLQSEGHTPSDRPEPWTDQCMRDRR